jgi:ATP-dependent DNA helicase DinG
MFNYISHFPYSQPREEQTKAIKFALDQFINKNKRFVIVEAGTGVGKSAIGITIGRYLSSLDRSGTYYLTTQKILQAQYMKDFKKSGLLSLKSSTNYRCKYYKQKTCAEARKELKVSSDGKFKMCCMTECRYIKDKSNFIDGTDGITNFPYFLAETNYAGNLKKRGLLVVDECHNVELQLSSFVEVTISEYFASNVLKLKVPDMTTQYQVYKWVEQIYFPKLLAAKKHYENQIEKLGLKSRMKDFLKISQQFDMLNKHSCKVERFVKVYKKDNWVMNETATETRNTRKFEFKPIDIGPFSESNLFAGGRRILLMSATIMNKDAFCEGLGIPIDECAFITLPSPFPIKNRPIIVSPIAKMGHRDIEAGLPKIAAAVKEILNQHKKEKGIIHCHSYKVANYIKKNIRSRRLLIHDSTNRDKILAKHIDDPRPTVLLSPSMAEGVDLKGEASRFQIICKIPYPYLGDKLVKKRMNKWKWWYPLQTAKIIVQSVGRSVRTADDHAVTYILDAGWNYFFMKNKDIFPDDFKRCVL